MRAMAILPHDQILRLHDAIIAARLSESRAALLAGIPAEFVASLPMVPFPVAQVMQDLDALNIAGALADGSTPLFTWLTNAIALTGGRRETKISRGFWTSAARLAPQADDTHLPMVLMTRHAN